ncbi:MAG: Trk system potassium transport protein TrkA [Desulfobacteraceae bacterium 4572_35.2]|nr:MAG: Trk system potassium transport protein TrkA [Desulfobacteraceae bacterium 4572_35.2]
MKILIIGAGQVGFFLCERLSQEGHEVTLIDRDETHLRKAQDRLNVMGLAGNGASAEILEQADIKNTDIFIAVTNMDEVNILACLLAREYDVKTRIARVKSIEYRSHGAILSKEKLGIDLLINPDDEVADEMVKISCRSGAFDVAEFVEGKIQFLGYRIGSESPLCGMTLRELGELRGMYHFVVTAITRDETTIIPRGEDRIEDGDSIFLFAHKKDLPAIQYLLQPKAKKKKMPRVFILGGSKIGVRIATQLENQHFDVRLVDRDEQRCRKVSAKLNKTMVINVEGTDIHALIEEGINNADVFIAVTEKDETNILCALLAKQHGASRTLALISKPELLNLAPSLGIDACVSPRLSAAGAILKYVRRGGVISLATIEGSNSEVLEFEVQQSSAIIGIPLKEINFPNGAIIGVIVHGSSYEIATAGDRVVVFALPDSLSKIEKFFA